MDGEAFEVWLSAVAVLTDQQRGEVFRALALAEARRGEPVAADAGIMPCETSRSAELARPRPRLRPCCMDQWEGRTHPYPVRGHAMRTDSGRPSSSMRFSA